MAQNNFKFMDISLNLPNLNGVPDSWCDYDQNIHTKYLKSTLVDILKLNISDIYRVSYK